jgi:hypothetical protein
MPTVASVAVACILTATSLTCPTSGLAWPPKGVPAGGFCSSDSYADVDGCSSAPCPGDTANNRTMLSGETAIPTWWPAGVNYHVGLCASDGSNLTDWTSVVSSSFPAACGASYDSSIHAVRVGLTSGGATCTITLVDFSLHNGGGIYIDDFTHCGTINITHSKFVVGSNGTTPIHQDSSGCDVITISDNDIDGGGTNGSAADPIYNPNPGYITTIERNNIHHTYAHFSTGNGNDTIKWNYYQDAMYGGGVHSDPYHYGSNVSPTINGLTISYNTSYQSTASGGYPGSVNSLIGFASANDFGGAAMANVSFDHNTSRGVGSTGHLCPTGGTTCAAVNYYIYLQSNSATTTNAAVVDNYMDMGGGVANGSCDIAAAGGSFTGTLTFSGNIDMNTGSADTACNTAP